MSKASNSLNNEISESSPLFETGFQSDQNRKEDIQIEKTTSVQEVEKDKDKDKEPQNNIQQNDAKDIKSEDLKVLDKITQDKNKALQIVQNRFYCWRLAILYSLVATFLYADQNVLAPNLTQIKKEFHFSDREGDAYLGGYINLAFFLVGIPAALLVGYLTPFTDRNRLLFIVVIIGQGPNLFAPLIKYYWQLFIIRFVTGISVGGTFPLIYSILGDLFPPKSRSLVSILIAISLGGGTGLGQVVAGYLGGSKFGWKLPLLVNALPNILIALFVYLTQKDPPRGASEESLQEHFSADTEFVYSSKMDRKKLVQVLKKPTNILAILQGLPGCLPWGVIIVYLADYIAQDQGLGVYKATTLTLMFGIGGILGVIVGGYVGQVLYNKRKELVCIFIGVSAMLSIVPFYFLFNSTLTKINFGFLNFMSFVGGIFANIAGVNIRSILLNVNLPEARGVALALHTSLDDVGKGLGPALNAVMIQKMGRKSTFNVSLIGWVVCGAFLAFCAFFITRDERKMQQALISQTQEVQQISIDDMEMSYVASQPPNVNPEQKKTKQKYKYQKLEEQQDNQNQNE